MTGNDINEYSEFIQYKTISVGYFQEDNIETRIMKIIVRMTITKIIHILKFRHQT